MTLSNEEAIEAVRDVMKFRENERDRLEKIHDYLRNIQPHPAAPAGAQVDVKRLAEISRVPIMDIIVSSVAQSMYVDGYRGVRADEDSPAWDIWQANRMDARQTGVHRSTLTYGASYVLVLPGEPEPVIRGFSPRKLTAVYDIDDDEWPVYALRKDSETRYRLYDSTDVYTFEVESKGSEKEFTLIDVQPHGAKNTPVVRFLCSFDQDEDNVGEVEPIFDLQDQVNLTTFELLVAQHYGSFRQRWAIGWTAANENELLKANAAHLWAFKDSPQDLQVGEFDQTDLAGYLDSREASLKHAATLSQTPVHELIGAMVNLSAEALVAAEQGQRRKVIERQISMGESWEQVLILAAELGGKTVDLNAQIRWRDTEARSLSATVDALGKMAEMLGIPPQELWERIPNVSQQDIERWKKALESGDAIGNLTKLLDAQAQPPAVEEQAGV